MSNGNSYSIRSRFFSYLLTKAMSLLEVLLSTLGVCLDAASPYPLQVIAWPGLAKMPTGFPHHLQVLPSSQGTRYV